MNERFGHKQITPSPGVALFLSNKIVIYLCTCAREYLIVNVTNNFERLIDTGLSPVFMEEMVLGLGFHSF